LEAATPGRKIITIPSSDVAFRVHVERLVARMHFAGPEALGGRLRRLFPRAEVRARQLTGENDVWYVYRDGGWRPDDTIWWRRPNVPRVEMSLDGWLIRATPGARGLLGVQAATRRRHFQEFVAPGTLDDASALFEIVKSGHDLDATVRVRPISGDVIACELHATREGNRLVGYLRLAGDIAPRVAPAATLPHLTTQPADDVVFARYAADALQTIEDPTPDELAVRLRRLYPHAQVATNGGGWLVQRDRAAAIASPSEWWHDRTLPKVTYDERGLILQANDAALGLINPELVGRHWHDFVTPGSTEQVNAVIEMITKAGWAVSRFRMPSADGSLIEFDSYTRVDGDVLTSVIRPVSG
jgi:hypothetical protein